mgnify:FL=1
MKRSIQLPLALAIAALPCVSAPVFAQSAGDFLVRGGLGHVSPNEKSGDLGGVPGNQVSVGNDSSLALTLAYLLSDNVGVELVGALPFKHDIYGAAALAGAGKVGSTKHLPPTVLAQYYFNPKGAVRPYVGAGLNFTWFFGEKTTGALAGTELKLGNSWGLAGEAGVDIDLGGNWFANAAVWYMDIDTKARTALGDATVQIDPWVGFIGLGHRF